VKLAKALVDAGPAERGAIVEKYRETKGAEYTDALARAAARMPGEAQAQVREALAERLTRMKPNTLAAYMQDPDRELRWAAAVAAGSKRKDQLRELAEALIALVADQDAQTAQAARASLKKLTGEDFGPEATAAPADRVKALTAWRKWWDEHK
jgi:HEAT repeat protein